MMRTIPFVSKGNNIALSNIATEPRSGSTVGGAIFFNNAGKTASLSNAVLNYGRISFSGATGATITLSNVEVKFAGSSLEGEGPYYAYTNPGLATVTASNLTVTMSAAIGRGLQTVVSMLPSGATIKLDAGTYYVSAALTKPIGVTVDTDTNGAIIAITQNIVDAAYTGTDGEAVGGIKRYSTIKAAVNGAIAGDTIFVVPGTYTEIGEIEITKALTIKGQNYWDGDNYYESTFVSVTPITGQTHCDTIFWAHDCADVYISGFTLDRAVEIGGTETPTSETGVVFTGGCDFNGSIISDCKVIGERVVPDDNCFSALSVIQVDNVIFENNIVEGVVNQNEFSAEEFYDGGIGELGGCEGIVIRGNHINGLGTAVSPRGGSGISCVMAGEVTIEDNEITGCRYGIYENQVDITITNNEIYSNDIGVQCGWTLALHNNSIYDNPVSISCGYSAEEKVDATSNYWGDTDYASITSTFDGNVAFFPWAMDETKDSDGNYIKLSVSVDWPEHAVALAAVNDAAADANYAAVQAALETNAAVLGLDLTAYNSLTTDRKTAVSNDLYNSKPEGGYTSEALKLAFDEIVATRIVFQNSMNLVNAATADAPLINVSFVTMLTENLDNVNNYTKHSEVAITDKITTLNALVGRYTTLNDGKKAAALLEVSSADYLSSTQTLDALGMALTTQEKVAVGDSYGGGIMAYILVEGDTGYDANVQHGLIAAAADQSATTVYWSNIYTALDGTEKAYGAGQANTTAIVAQSGCTSGAAYLCDNLEEGGYTDWYLPSPYELNKLYLNRTAIGGFAADYSTYWASYTFLQDGTTTNSLVWMQEFTDGGMFGTGRADVNRVRAVRTF